MELGPIDIRVDRIAKQGNQFRSPKSDKPLTRFVDKTAAFVDAVEVARAAAPLHPIFLTNDVSVLVRTLIDGELELRGLGQKQAKRRPKQKLAR